MKTLGNWYRSLYTSRFIKGNKEVSYIARNRRYEWYMILCRLGRRGNPLGARNSLTSALLCVCAFTSSDDIRLRVYVWVGAATYHLRFNGSLYVLVHISLKCVAFLQRNGVEFNIMAFRFCWIVYTIFLRLNTLLIYLCAFK